MPVVECSHILLQKGVRKAIAGLMVLIQNENAAEGNGAFGFRPRDARAIVRESEASCLILVLAVEPQEQ